ncbi:MAG: hypothetical protein ACXVCP_00300 [Bdellovibrio sp.]
MSEQGAGKREFWFVETQKYIFSKYDINPKWITNDVKIHVVNVDYVEQLEKEKAILLDENRELKDLTEYLQDKISKLGGGNE